MGRGSGGAEPTQLGPTLDRGLVGPCGPGGLGGRSPPSLELQCIVMTRMLQYVVHESAQFLQSPESGDAWRRAHEAEQWDVLVPKNAPEAAAARSAESFSGWRNHPQRDKKRRGRTGRENDDDDNGGPGQVSVGRGGSGGDGAHPAWTYAGPWSCGTVWAGGFWGGGAHPAWTCIGPCKNPRFCGLGRTLDVKTRGFVDP